ncbi:N-6 DNA methylase [Streptomyces sp. NPDC004134]|uniref:N-6 DNA methylase n=1 Tax=Streptomyces sp. NPDC004134 TaxID=3364691 RepID=UPI00369E620F
MPDEHTAVTAAGIARLAGVGRAAVSNWRRRHTDFPRPVGGTEASPTFELAAVEEWLRGQGKIRAVPLRERVWQQVAAHPGGAPAGLALAGAALLVVRERPAEWLALAEGTDAARAAGLPPALREVLAARLGSQHPVNIPDDVSAALPLLRGAGELAAEAGSAPRAYEFLLTRYLEANPRQHTLTPPEPASLMAATAGVDRRAAVLDPACGAGTLLTAAPGEGPRYAQEADPDLAALAALRLALHTGAEVRAAAADSLRADAFADLAVDAVLCHPPFNERNWGHDELAYDPRFGYGLPARTESELAWVQHALARLRDGGTAVLLMPPAAASRRSGRRVRAELLRRGALRAVVALPVGAAVPYGLPLHLWVLRKPGATAPAGGLRLLFVDAAERYGTGRDRIRWAPLHADVTAAWRAFDRDGEVAEEPGAVRTVSVVDLLDDDVDLTPARHLPPAAADGSAAALGDVRERLAEALRLSVDRTPPPPAGAAAREAPLTTVGELARAGALKLRMGGAGAVPPGGAAPPVLTEHDVAGGTAPSGRLPEGAAEEPLLVAAGDVVVPVLGGGRIARVVDEDTAGAALGRNLALLRPDAAAVDPWFLAGFLRGTANARQASSHASTATRLDVRRLQLPRLPPAEQRRHGELFQALAAFEDALREAGRLGGRLVQGLYDGLAEGSVEPW